MSIPDKTPADAQSFVIPVARLNRAMAVTVVILTLLSGGSMVLAVGLGLELQLTQDNNKMLRENHTMAFVNHNLLMRCFPTERAK